MKHRYLIAVVILLLSPAIALPEPIATVLETNGRVEIRPPDQDWSRAEQGREVVLGSTISTGFGASAIVRAGNATLEIEQLTRMRLDELLRQEGVERSELHLEVGRVRADVDAVEDIQAEFQLSSPVSTAAVRGTSFVFDGHSLRVLEGSVEFLNRSGRRRTVAPGESSRRDGIQDLSSPADEAERASTTSPYVPGPSERTESARAPRVRRIDTGTLVIEWFAE